MSSVILAVLVLVAAVVAFYVKRRYFSFSLAPMDFDLDASAAADLIKREGSALVILDVRTPKEYAAGRLEGGVNLDYFAGDFKDKVSRLDKSKIYLVHCAVGGRSAKAVELMKGLGFSRAFNMRGGIQAWQVQGHPVKN